MSKSRYQQAPTILCHPGDLQGRGHYRIIQPCAVLQENGFARPYVSPRLLTNESLDALSPDIVVWNAHEKEAHRQEIKRYRKAISDAFFVYEVDDLLTAVPEENAHKVNIPKDIHVSLKKAMKLCDAVSVTTEPLAEAFKKKYGISDIRVIPNYIPKKIFDLVGKICLPFENDKPRVGWAGGVSHGGDLKFIKEVMDILGDEVQWVFFGMLPPGVDESQCEYHPPVSIDQYLQKLASLRLDVAIAPLDINDFNRCKSNLRLLEYGVCRYPVVATDIDPYQGSPASLVKNDPSEWADAIQEEILSGPSGTELNSWVEGNYILEDHLESRIKEWLPSNAEPFVPKDVRNDEARDLVVVGQSTLDKPHYSKFSDVPDNCNVLYVRPGTYVTPEQVERLAAHEGASISALSNDATFPVANQFSPLDINVGLVIDDIAKRTNDLTLEIYRAMPPVVYMTRQAIAKVGLPDPEYGDYENSLVDWSMRCVEAGMKNVMAMDVYVATMQGGPAAQMDKLTTRFAEFQNKTEEFVQADPFSDIREQMDLVYHKENYNYPPPAKGDYQEWISLFDTVSAHDISKMQSNVIAEIESDTDIPKFAVVMPVYNITERYLREAIDSVIKQSYVNWQLCICDDGSTRPGLTDVVKEYCEKYPDQIKAIYHEENLGISAATNDALSLAEDCDWVVFLDHDDALPPHALYMLWDEIRQNSNIDFIYSDHDKIDGQGVRKDYHLKTGFDYELLLAYNYVTHLSAYRKSIVDKVGPFNSAMDGAQDYDFALRYLEQINFDRSKIKHIPRILYHWRAIEGSTSLDAGEKKGASAKGKDAVLAHLTRVKKQAMVKPHPALDNWNQIQYGIPDPAPMVSIIVCTKDHPEFIMPCIESIRIKTAYPNYELIVVDNGTTDKEAKGYLRSLKGDRVRVIPYDKPFNFAEANNFAAKEAKGDLVLLLNNDTQVLDASWLSEMVGTAIQNGVGVVGARLIYPDGKIQHTGVIRNRGMCAHANAGLPYNNPGYMGLAMLTHEASSVTGACFMVKKSLWDELGGLDEAFAMNFNDVDFCERAMEAGYRNVVAGGAMLVHNESGTRKGNAEMNELQQAGTLLMTRHPHSDPYDNPSATFNKNHMRIPKWGVDDFSWRDKANAGLLLVNGTDEEFYRFFREGYSVFLAESIGPLLKITRPSLQNVDAWDTRVSLDKAKEICEGLNIQKVVVSSLGDGTIELLPFIMRLDYETEYLGSQNEELCPRRNFLDGGENCNKGWTRGECQACIHRNGSPFGYVDVTGWKNIWNRFLSAKNVRFHGAEKEEAA